MAVDRLSHNISASIAKTCEGLFFHTGMDLTHAKFRHPMYAMLSSFHTQCRETGTSRETHLIGFIDVWRSEEFGQL